MMKLMETLVNAFAYTVLLFFTLIFLAVALLIVWQQAPKEAVLHSDDPKVWRILVGYWLQEHVDFVYHGGSESGTPRRVVPREVFQAEGYSSVWFRGYCELRQADRTFNLRRVEFLPAGDDYIVE